MNEELLVNYASPTLANKKLANLFTFKNTESIDIDEMVKGWNDILNQRNVYIEVLKKSSSYAQIYAYRPDKLKYVLNENKTKSLLKKLGYKTSDMRLAINYLKKRMEENDFPHEIGIFLGYPYEDVEGFIKNKGVNFLVSGYWKVYDNKEDKINLFNSYKKITKSYQTLFTHYKDIEKLCIY